LFESTESMFPRRVRLSGVGPEFRQPLITTIISIDDLMKMMSISRQPGSQASAANLSAALPACPAVRPLSLVLREGPPADAWERAEGPRKRTCEVTLDCSANAGSYHPRGPQRSVQRRPHSHARVLMHERQGPAATCGSVVFATGRHRCLGEVRQDRPHEPWELDESPAPLGSPSSPAVQAPGLSQPTYPPEPPMGPQRFAAYGPKQTAMHEPWEFTSPSHRVTGEPE
jgi:hypothetical protein